MIVIALPVTGPQRSVDNHQESCLSSDALQHITQTQTQDPHLQSPVSVSETSTGSSAASSSQSTEDTRLPQMEDSIVTQNAVTEDMASEETATSTRETSEVLQTCGAIWQPCVLPIIY